MGKIRGLVNWIVERIIPSVHNKPCTLSCLVPAPKLDYWCSCTTSILKYRQSVSLHDTQLILDDMLRSSASHNIYVLLQIRKF